MKKGSGIGELGITYVLLDLLINLILELLLPQLLDIALPLEVLLIIINLAVMQAQIVVVLLRVLLHLLLVALQGLLQDGGLHGVVVLDHAVVLAGFQVRRVKKMLHSLILSFKEGILDTVLAVLLTDLIMRPPQLARLPGPLRPLVVHETLQVILQLVVHFAAALLHLLLPDEGEVRVLHGHSVGHFEALFLHVLGLYVVVGLGELVHLLELNLLLPIRILLLQHCQLLQKLLLLLLLQVRLVRCMRDLVPDLLQVVLHQLVRGHLFVIVDLLPKLHQLLQRTLPLVKILVAHITRSLENDITVLRVRIRHIEDACMSLRFVIQSICYFGQRRLHSQLIVPKLRALLSTRQQLRVPRISHRLRHGIIQKPTCGQ